jgi:hypothetical protein
VTASNAKMKTLPIAVAINETLNYFHARDEENTMQKREAPAFYKELLVCAGYSVTSV